MEEASSPFATVNVPTPTVIVDNQDLDHARDSLNEAIRVLADAELATCYLKALREFQACRSLEDTARDEVAVWTGLPNIRR